MLKRKKIPELPNSHTLKDIQVKQLVDTQRERRKKNREKPFTDQHRGNSIKAKGELIRTQQIIHLFISKPIQRGNVTKLGTNILENRKNNKATTNYRSTSHLTLSLHNTKPTNQYNTHRLWHNNLATGSYLQLPLFYQAKCHS